MEFAYRSSDLRRIFWSVDVRNVCFWSGLNGDDNDDDEYNDDDNDDGDDSSSGVDRDE